MAASSPEARAAHEPVAQRTGVTARHGEHGVTDPQAHPSTVAAHLVDRTEGDEPAPVDAHEARVGPLLLEVRERDADEMAPVGGDQPGVVAVGLDVEHVGATDEPGDAAELDGDRLIVDLVERS